MRALLFLAVVATGATACSGSDGIDCGGTAPVAGTWDYHGAQTAPAPGSTLAGTLAVSSVDGCTFSGTLSVAETPEGGGSVVNHAGAFFGIALSTTVVNFDVQFTAGTPRTHVATVTGDSLAGTWIEGTGSSAPRGSFWAKRPGP